jgi:hypothetical protein
MKKFFPFISLILISFNSFSQKVENVDFNFVDDKIVIFYDLVDCDSKYKYDIDIKFIDDQGNTIIPRNLSGDYGLVTCGRNKKVEWDLFKQVNKFEGNYKAEVSIRRVLNHRGNEITEKKEMRIVSIQEANNIVEAHINHKLTTGSIYFVNSKQGLLSSSGDAVKKVGMVKITKTDYEQSSGTFSLNKYLTPQMVEKHLEYLNLQKFRRFDIGFYTGFLWAPDYYANVGFGVYLDCKLLGNKALLGVDLGYAPFWQPIDLTLSVGVTPYLLNSKIFSFGFELQPLEKGEEQGTWGDDEYREINIGPRYGLYGGFEFKRFKVKSSVGILNYYEYEYWEGGDDPIDLYSLYFSIGLKFRVN